MARTNDRPAVPPQARRALAIVRSHLGGRVVGAYLHGSAAMGGLRPQSDIDLLVVVDGPLPYAARRKLVAALMKISAHPAQGALRPLELIVFTRDELSRLSYPPRSEFAYGEWLREAFEAGEVPEPGSDPEFTIMLAQARLHAICLAGPAPATLLPRVPAADIRRAIADALPALIDTLRGDERNVLLTLARMWHTLATGEIATKDAAAGWAAARLPAGSAAPVRRARQAYLGPATDEGLLPGDDVRRTAAELVMRVRATLRSGRIGETGR